MTDGLVTGDPQAPAVESDLGEVVEVFTGESLEEAMAAAVAALGPDLQVRRARKVRSGVRGLMGKDRYEVLAVPAGGGRSSPEAVTAALEGLLERAESEEAAGTATPPAAATASTSRTPPPAPEPVPAATLRRSTPVAAPRREPDLAERAPHPQPDLAEHRDHGHTASLAASPTAPPTTEQASVEPVPAEPTPVEPGTRGSGWSRTRLLDLGVPAAVVAAVDAALPAGEPTEGPSDRSADDLRWLVALTTAVAATVPPPAQADADHPVVLDGHGTAGALALLEAGVRGTPPGRLTTGDRTVAATALELALAIRAAVLS